MRTVFSALLVGLLFGLGLTVSGMINPAKVLGFLDLYGAWDASLALVMGAALAVTLPASRMLLRRDKPWLAPRFELPTKRTLDPRLVVGAALFGVGWGLAGICPGPALTTLAVAPRETGLFVLAMIGGMVLYQFTFAPRPTTSRSRDEQPAHDPAKRAH